MGTSYTTWLLVYYLYRLLCVDQGSPQVLVQRLHLLRRVGDRLPLASHDVR